MPYLKGGLKALGGMVIVLLLFVVTIPILVPAPVEKEIQIEIHDASPLWGTDGLDSILTIIEGHQVDRTIIFVIPNHGAAAPLTDHPDFVDHLKALEDEGYMIGAHGYTHEGFEFFCSREEAEILVEKSNSEFDRAGLDPGSFYPPRYLLSHDALGVLVNNYGSIFVLTRIYEGDQVLPYTAHEFTFGLPPWIALPLAKMSYILNRDPVYRLTLHVDYASSKNSLMTLDDFLTWTDG